MKLARADKFLILFNHCIKKPLRRNFTGLYLGSKILDGISWSADNEYEKAEGWIYKNYCT